MYVTSWKKVLIKDIKLSKKGYLWSFQYKLKYKAIEMQKISLMKLWALKIEFSSVQNLSL